MNFTDRTQRIGKIATFIVACALTACGGGGGGAALPAGTAATAAPPQPFQIISENGQNIELTGSIVTLFSGGFTIQGGQGVGYLHIYTNPATIITGPAPYVGENVDIKGVGSPSTSVAAASVTQILASPSPGPSSPTPVPTATSNGTPQPSGTPIPVPTGILLATGPVSNSGPGVFTIFAGRNYGSMHIYTSPSTSFVNGQPQNGNYAVVVGTGKLGYTLTGVQVAQYTSAPGTVQVSGTVAQSTGYGFVLTTSSGTLPVALTSSTVVGGAPLVTGAQVNVSGLGASGVGVVAVQIVVAAPTPNPSSSPSPTPGPIAMTHVPTADYLGGNFGQTHWQSGQWGPAVPYLTWAQTNAADSITISSFGIQTQDYVDPNRVEPGDPMWGYISGNESSFAHTCGGSRVMMGSQYVTDPTNGTLESEFSSYVSNISAQGRFNMIFEDNAGALGAYTPYTTFTPGLPCVYSGNGGDAAWTAGEQSLNQASSLPIVVNGLESPYNNGPGLVLNVLSGGSNTVGGNFEHCYSDSATPKTTGSLWTITENTELIVNNENKIFQCMLRNLNDGAASVDERIYAYASYLMTYSPQNDIYWEEFQTPSGLHVFPESELVALDPKVSQPGDVSSLLQTGGAYGREYGQCYIAGHFVGPCAVVVNPDNNSAHTFPFPQYQHTLLLNGEGVLDGGTIATNGPPPPASLPSGEAAIVFP